MGLLFDIHTIVKVAQFYYNDGMLQQEIAKRLKISRPYVSLLLSKAKDLGIVEVSIRNPFVSNEELNRKFEEKFGLRKVVTVNIAHNNKDFVKSVVASQAVSVLNEYMKNGNKVGIAWGSMLHEIVSNYAKTNIKISEVVPLVGEINISGNSLLNNVVRTFAEHLGAKWNLIYAPYIVPRAEDKELYMQSSSMKTIIDKWKEIDVAVMGIGNAPSKNHYYSEWYQSKREIMDNSVVGDLCARFFDINGKFVEHGINDYIIGIMPEIIKNIPTTIAVSSSVEKAVSILGALRTGVIDIIVLDEITANEVLDLSEKM